MPASKKLGRASDERLKGGAPCSHRRRARPAQRVPQRADANAPRDRHAEKSGERRDRYPRSPALSDASARAEPRDDRGVVVTLRHPFGKDDQPKGRRQKRASPSSLGVAKAEPELPGPKSSFTAELEIPPAREKRCAPIAPPRPCARAAHRAYRGARRGRHPARARSLPAPAGPERNERARSRVRGSLGELVFRPVFRAHCWPFGRSFRASRGSKSSHRPRDPVEAPGIQPGTKAR